MVNDPAIVTQTQTINVTDIPTETDLLPGFTSTVAKAITNTTNDDFVPVYQQALKVGKVRVPKKNRSSNKKVGISIGNIVSGRFGPLQPKQEGQKRRVREKVYGKVIEAVSYKKWLIMYANGETDVKTSNQLTIEDDKIYSRPSTTLHMKQKMIY